MEKEYYGKNYDKAMENIRKEQSRMRADFLKKYPNADISKFEFDVTLKRNGDVDSTAIYFKNSDITGTYITSNTFLNDKSMTKYLYNMEKYPKIWQSNGTIQKIPESNI